MINFNYLEAFLSLAETLNFSQTAKKLQIAQPAVSRQIRQLEEQLGVQLFIRDRQKVTLSDAGKKLRLKIDPLFRELQGTVASLQDHAEELSGKVSIGCYQEIGQSLFFDHFLSFQKQHPAVTLDVRFGGEQEIWDRVSNGILDFGIVFKKPDQEGVKAYPLVNETTVLVTRAKNKRDLEDPIDGRFVFFREVDSLMQRYLRTFHPRCSVSDLRVLVAVNSHRSMVQALLSEDCYAVLPVFSIRKELEKGQLRIASPHRLKAQMYLLHLENDLMERKKKLFLEHLLKGLRYLDI